MKLTVKKFQELTTTELYEILKARAEIFIMEQEINYQDMDDIDYKSLHCFFTEDKKVIAYLRAFYQENDGDIVRIGESIDFTTRKRHRKRLIRTKFKGDQRNMKCKKIVMDAQKYAVGFYEKFGFKTISDDFYEEGILHVVMELDV